MSPHAPQFHRCRGCRTLKTRGELHGGRCEACRPKAVKPEPIEQFELSIEAEKPTKKS